MTKPRLVHLLPRRSRRAALLLTLVLAVGGLSGAGVATAQTLPPAAGEAVANLAPIVGSPAMMKATPILFDSSGAVTASSGNGAEAYSPTRSPEGFVQKVREARGAGGGS